MPGSFNAKPLPSLEAIYRFVGGLRGSSRVDVSSPISLVHDVSREAEKGASLIFELSHSVTTGGASVDAFTVVEVADLWSGALGGIAGRLTALGRTPVNTDVYLLALWAHITAAGAGNLDSVQVGYTGPQNARYVRIAGTGEWREVMFGNAASFGSVLAGGQYTIINVDGMGNVLPPNGLSGVVYPVQVERLNFRTKDNFIGPVTVTYRELFAFVPIGGEPPKA